MFYEYYRDNFRDKFRKCLIDRYPPIPNRDGEIKKEYDLPGFKEDYLNHMGIQPGLDDEAGIQAKKRLSSRVDKWLRKSNNSVPGLDSLLDICDVLRCDPEYFFTDQDIINRDNKYLSELAKTDLETIEYIRGLSSLEKGMLADLCKSGMLSDLLQVLATCGMTDAPRRNEDSFGYVTEYTYEESESFLLESTLGRIRPMLKTIRDMYKRHRGYVVDSRISDISDSLLQSDHVSSSEKMKIAKQAVTVQKRINEYLKDYESGTTY